MATVVLSWAGSTLATAGAPWLGVAGSVLGAAVGSAIDASLAPAISVGKTDDVGPGGSIEGAAVPRVWGIARVSGLIVWSPKMREKKKVKRRGGFLGIGGTKVKEWHYHADLQHVVCVARHNARIVRVEADDKAIWIEGQASEFTIRNRQGTLAEGPDPLVVNAEASSPRYYGYVTSVTENLHLNEFGRRRPQMRYVVRTDAVELADVILDVATECKLDASLLDVSQVRGDAYKIGAEHPVKGVYWDDGRQDARAFLKQVCSAFGVDIASFGGKVRFVPRGGGPVASVEAPELRAMDWSSLSGAASGEGPLPPALEEEIGQPTEPPRRVDVAALEPDSYKRRVIGYGREGVDHAQASTIELPMVCTTAFAEQVARRESYDAWSARRKFRWSLLPGWLRLTPTDVVSLPLGGGRARVRLMKVGTGQPGEVRFEGVLDRAEVMSQPAGSGTGGGTPPDDTPVVPTQARLWSAPFAEGSDGLEPGFYVAACGSGPNAAKWRGCSVYRCDADHPDPEAWVHCGEVAEPATMGRALGALADGTAAEAFDAASTVPVELDTAQDLEPATDAEVISGINYALLGSELLGFATPTLTQGSPRRYTLSRLYRGMRQSAMTGHAAEERFVLLSDDSHARFAVPESLVGTTVFVKCVSPGLTLADVAAQSVAIAPASAPWFTPGGPLDPDFLAVEDHSWSEDGLTQRVTVTPAWGTGDDPSKAGLIGAWEESSNGGASWSAVGWAHAWVGSLQAGQTKRWRVTMRGLAQTSGAAVSTADVAFRPPPSGSGGGSGGSRGTRLVGSGGATAQESLTGAGAAFGTTRSVPANALQAGHVLRVCGGGSLSLTGGSGKLQLTKGGAAIAESESLTWPSGSSLRWFARLEATVRSSGPSGSMLVQGEGYVAAGGGAAFDWFEVPPTLVPALDTTVANALGLAFTSTISGTFVLEQLYVELMDTAGGGDAWRRDAQAGDGVTSSWALSGTPLADSETVTLNGVVLTPGLATGFSYEISGASLVYRQDNAPYTLSSGDRGRADYRI